MLTKYFYTRFLDVYLCYQGQEEDSEARRTLAREIGTIRRIASDLCGAESAHNIQREARNDAATLRENKVYWISDDPAQRVVLLNTAGNSAVSRIISKTIQEV